MISVFCPPLTEGNAVDSTTKRQKGNQLDLAARAKVRFILIVIVLSSISILAYYALLSSFFFFCCYSFLYDVISVFRVFIRFYPMLTAGCVPAQQKTVC